MKKLLGILAVAICPTLFAAQVAIPMYTTHGNKYIGTVVAKDSRYGLELVPHLKDLTPGAHGFHIHVHPNCANNGMSAGGHFDPYNTNKHLGPYNNNGHLGDLPVLIVNKDGTATIPVLAPRLTVKTIRKHSLMIHAGSDNYSDVPEKNGGGGARIACGVIH